MNLLLRSIAQLAEINMSSCHNLFVNTNISNPVVYALYPDTPITATDITAAAVFPFLFLVLSHDKDKTFYLN
jgi:hypothetical protein